MGYTKWIIKGMKRIMKLRDPLVYIVIIIAFVIIWIDVKMKKNLMSISLLNCVFNSRAFALFNLVL